VNLLKGNPWENRKMDIVANRRLKLQHLINIKFGGSQAAFATKTEINQGELSGLLRNKSFGEKKARKIEQIVGLPSGYLDSPIGEDTDAVKVELEDIYHQLPENMQRLVLEQARALYNAVKK
jgi:hypothetical protein